MRWTISRERVTIPDAGDGFPMVSLRQTVLGPDTPPVEVVPASFTDEDVERVAEAIRGALADTWTIARETTEAPTEAELDAAARGALSAYLEPTTKGDT